MPDTNYNQNYGQVGNVYNAQNLYLPAEAVAGGQRPIPEEATLAATLVDRVPQRDALIERLEAANAAESFALVAVVQGCSPDLHQALVTRCARIELVEQFGGVGAWRYLKRLPWPTEGRGTVMGLLRDIRSKLSLPKELDQAGIEAAVRGLTTNICFSHFIDEAAWAADSGALARDWIDYIASDALRPAPGFRLVAFLCVEQREAELPAGGFAGLLARIGRFGGARPRPAALDGFVDGLRAQFPPQNTAARVIVPPPLGLIDRSDIGDWLSNAGTYLRNTALEDQLMTLPNRLFEHGAHERHFDEVFGVLQTELANLMRPTRYVEVNL